MALEESINFLRVNDRVTTSGVVGAKRLSDLGRLGYGVVINLLPDESEHAVKNERQIVEEQGLRYVHIPVDFGRPTLADFDEFDSAMNEAQEKRVHIHCAANYRVTAFYALYAELGGIWTQSQGQDFVERLWRPQDHEGWPVLFATVRARAKTSSE
ncbi:MAG: hypothetical protein CMN28_15535 [Salinisphaeraceae bacterium]|jgi:protein tyrosine phosphatase (PTP) superfamily phosphohydrolase (DUF442 family)|nr:hypothetical protein [Salinisphaeraceae bacterium]